MRKKKFIFLHYGPSLFLLGKDKEHSSVFQENFHNAFKKKEYDCSYECYCENASHEFYMFTGNCSKGSEKIIDKKVNLESSVRSLIKNNDCDLYFVLGYELYNEFSGKSGKHYVDKLLDLIVESKDLKQIYFMSTCYFQGYPEKVSEKISDLNNYYKGKISPIPCCLYFNDKEINFANRYCRENFNAISKYIDMEDTIKTPKADDGRGGIGDNK